MPVGTLPSSATPTRDWPCGDNFLSPCSWRRAHSWRGGSSMTDPTLRGNTRCCRALPICRIPFCSCAPTTPATFRCRTRLPAVVAPSVRRFSALCCLMTCCRCSPSRVSHWLVWAFFCCRAVRYARCALQFPPLQSSVCIPRLMPLVCASHLTQRLMHSAFL